MYCLGKEVFAAFSDVRSHLLCVRLLDTSQGVDMRADEFWAHRAFGSRERMS